MRHLQHLFLNCKHMKLIRSIHFFFDPPQRLVGTVLRLIFLGVLVGCFALTPASAQAALHRYKVSGVMPPFGAVTSAPAPQISPDGKNVVYVADQQTDGAFELYTAPINGSSAPVRISPLLPTTANIFNFLISPDSSRVVYLADQDTDDVFELYGVYDDSYRQGLLPLFMPAILSGSINKK